MHEKPAAEHEQLILIGGFIERLLRFSLDR